MNTAAFPIATLSTHPRRVPVKCPNCDKWFASKASIVNKQDKVFCSMECYNGVGGERKRCSGCKKIKKRTEFKKCDKNISGLRCWCRYCENKSATKWNEKVKNNKDTYRNVCSNESCKNKTTPFRKLCEVHLGTPLPDFFSGKQDSYKDKIIDYPESPTGKAYIGIAKKPLMKNSTGFGYQGVLIQTDDRSLVQCCNCGEWLRALPIHLKKCSKLNASEYKEKYGLNQSTGLISDAQSMAHTRSILKNTEQLKQWRKDTGYTPSKETLAKANKTRKRLGHTAQQMNNYGTCPLQIKARTVEFIKVNKEMPNSSNRGQTLYGALIRRFGSFKGAMEEYGLPYRIKGGHGSRPFMFPSGETHRFDLKDSMQRDMFFELIMSKCPVMHETL